MPLGSQPPATLCLQAQPVERVWGSHTLSQRIGLDMPEAIGELWLAYDQNKVQSGLYAGQTVADLLPSLGQSFIGQAPFKRYGLELPLLVKFLHAQEWLSVQVHPDDAYAHRVEAASGFHGKTEAWQVLEGQGEIVYGLKQPANANALRQAALSGDLWNQLSRYSLSEGQTVYMPAGTIHALGPGLLIYEVQQRSDLTYRLYDYGRPRALHLDKGLEVARLKPTPIPTLTPWVEGEKTTLLASEAFVLESHTLGGRQAIQSPLESFLLLTLVEGTAHWLEGNLGWGNTLLIGAGQTVELQGNARFLATFIPTQERLERYPRAVRV